jgi:hypothetical protein
MQIQENSSASPLRACLKSDDGRTKIVITVLGYQFPSAENNEDANWCVISIAYERSGLKVHWRSSNFNAESFKNCLDAICSFRGYVADRIRILTPQYGSDFTIDLQSRTPALQRPTRRGSRKIKLPNFSRANAGVFVEAELCQMPIRFRTTRTNLKKFTDEISLIAATFSTRYLRKERNLNPVKTLRAKFRGVDVSVGVTNWFTQWIEDDVKRQAQPVVRVINRRRRRSKNKMSYLGDAEYGRLLERAIFASRQRVIYFWSHPSR